MNLFYFEAELVHWRWSDRRDQAWTKVERGLAILKEILDLQASSQQDRLKSKPDPAMDDKFKWDQVFCN